MIQAKKQPAKHSAENSTLSVKFSTIFTEAGLVLLVGLIAYLLLCLTTYSENDPGPTHTGSNSELMNMGGHAGAWIADLLFTLFGRSAYLLLFFISIIGWRIYKNRIIKMSTGRLTLLTVSGLVLSMVGICGLEQIYFPLQNPNTNLFAGGIIGYNLAGAFVVRFGVVGSAIIFLVFFIAGVTLLGQVAWLNLMDRIGYAIFSVVEQVNRLIQDRLDRNQGAKVRKKREVTVKKIRSEIVEKKPPRIEPKIEAPVESVRKQKEHQVSLFTGQSANGVLPDLSLLDPPDDGGSGYSREELESMSQLLIKKLKDFNVDITVEAVQPGPVITRFEIDPAPGVKASQIVGLSRDLARSLSVVSVRVVENIPGKTVIGIEIPNQTREIVRLVEGLSSDEYEKSASPLTLVLGKDIAGNAVITDLVKMPHVLIAGTTGSGKSVCISALILSLVYKSTPEQVRMIMVDPKFLELSIYDGIPHLLTPVVTDMNMAANALRWCIVEMDRRFRVMAATGVRNIAGFNKKVDNGKKTGAPLFDPTAELEPGQVPEPLDRLPYIVVVVDELADLMMVVGKKIEEIIIRIAQRARAAGIHLVLATQRPSVDVVTGLIKANVPTRIAFQVSSRVDSRTVLDQMGAEQLLGQGDMLFLPPGSGFTQRVHGSFVSDDEVANVVAQLKGMGKPNYLDEITTGNFEGNSKGEAFSEGGGESDPLYDDAVSFVTKSRKASISAVQRALRVGYNRAARMVETMEEGGVVSSADNGKREVLAPPPPE
ncbi:MAG: cell division protein FtsK [Gammaproteobacteria bacterium]|nr:cell division protein FtsK [Gammaproteobacteria bacterium]